MYDTINLKSPVSTICTGFSASYWGRFLIICGQEKEDVYSATRTGHDSCSQSGGARGQASNIEIQAREIIKTKGIKVLEFWQNWDKITKRVLKDF